MKIIVTESQYKKFILEGEKEAKHLHRRMAAIESLIDKYIEETDPSEFGDEFEYTDNIISWVITDVGLDDMDEDGEIRELMIDLYADRLFEEFFEVVGHPDDEEDDDDEEDEEDYEV
jgi:hypothetical protein